jgi:ABC-type antimicrobial peptide transport system permease subunit
MALGATSGEVLRLVLAQSLGVVAGGAMAGILLALASTRLITTFLFGLSPTNA